MDTGKRKVEIYEKKPGIPNKKVILKRGKTASLEKGRGVQRMIAVSKTSKLRTTLAKKSSVRKRASKATRIKKKKRTRMQGHATVAYDKGRKRSPPI